jgi:hypothetical protein
MSGMFRDCTNFNQNISNWTINITDDFSIEGMYENCGISQENMPVIQIRPRPPPRPQPRPRQPIPQPTPVPQMTREEQMRLQRDIAERTKNIATAQPQETNEFPECIICGDILNNEIGPGALRACVENCNDAVKVCRNDHIFHRGCILNACNAEAVDVISQMGFEASGYVRQQQRRNKCPICQTELNPTCELLKTAPAMSIDELKEYKNKNGGKRKRRNTKRRRGGKKRNTEKKSGKRQNTKKRRGGKKETQKRK